MKKRATPHPEARPVIELNFERDTRNLHEDLKWAADEEKKRKAEGRPRAPLFPEEKPPP